NPMVVRVQKSAFIEGLAIGRCSRVSGHCSRRDAVFAVCGLGAKMRSAGAQERMRVLHIPPGLQRFYIRTTVNPSTRVSGRALRDFYLYSTEEQRERLQRARE